MRTNISIDDELMKTAMFLSGIKTKKELVEKAIALFVRIKKQEKIRKYRGKLKWEGNLDEMRSDK
jgi:Arc/MetJ family transcription regulator